MSLPNRNPTLKSLLSQRLLDHLDTQLLDAGRTPDKLVGRSNLCDEQQPGPTLRERLDIVAGLRKTMPEVRLSLGIGCNVSDPLRTHIATYCANHDISAGQVVRNALDKFLADPYVRKPNITAHTKFLPRNRTLVGTINPNTAPMLREQLHQYAASLDITTSAVIRRATYEYTRDPDQPEVEAVFFDAWGDRTKS